MKTEIEDANNQIEMAKNSGDLEKASELQYGELPRFAAVRWTKRKMRLKQADPAQWYTKVFRTKKLPRLFPAGPVIPVAKLTESERNKTLHLDDELHKRVIGQDDGVYKSGRSDYSFQGRH